MSDLYVAGLMFGLAGILSWLWRIATLLEEIRDRIAGGVSDETADTDTQPADPPSGSA